jgi:hypothetical protein
MGEEESVPDFWKRLDDKTKEARAAAEIAATIVGSTMAGPTSVPTPAQVDSVLAPTQQSQVADLSEQEDWAKWKKLELEREADRAGKRVPEATRTAQDRDSPEPTKTRPRKPERERGR